MGNSHSSRGPWARHRKGLLAALLGIAIALVATGPLASLSLAQTCDATWASTSASGSWSTAANWSPASVPTGSQNVCLPAGSYTVTVTGSQTAGSVSVGAGVTLAITISAGNGAALTLNQNGASSNSGTISLTDTDASGTGSPAATLQLDTGATLTNDGTILAAAGAAGLGTRQIVAQASSSTLNNASDGTITINQTLQIDDTQSGTFTTSGDVTIASGQKLLVDSAGGSCGGNPEVCTPTFNIAGGTITDNGALEQGISETGPAGNGTLNVTGGTITGAGLLAALPSAVSFNGSGTGTYTFEGVSGATCGGPCTIAGTIGSGQTVVLRASTATGPVHLTANSNVTNDGTIELTDPDTTGSSQEADLGIASGDTLTNHGTIVSDPGGAGLGNNQIGGIGTTGTLDNASDGTITVNQSLQLDSQQSGTFTNNGAISIATGKALLADPSGGPTFVNLDGGSVTDNGTAEIGVNPAGSAVSGASFAVNGGAVTGNPIVVATATTTFSGSGSGAFTLTGATSIFGGGTLAGTIGANDSVTMSASTGGTGSAGIQTSGAVVNDGTFTMTDSDSTASTSAFDELNIGSGSSFTNDGTMVIAPGPVGSGYRSIDGTLTNNGTVDVDMLLQLGLHAASGIDNSGTFNIAAGQGVMISGSYDQSAGATSLAAGADLDTSSVLVGGGQITGSGTICGPGGTQSAPCGSGSSATSVVNGGTIAPSPTPSTLTLHGDYSQASGGTLAVGVNASGNDQLAVTGSGDTASLDGTLAVSTANGFTPATGTTYQVLAAPGGVSGTFATTSGTGPYTLAYNADDVALTAATPAPAVSLSSSSLTFGSASNTIAVGATSSQTLTLTDSGHAALVLGALSLGGSDASDFSLSADQCSGRSLQAGGSCTVSVDFAPAATGTDSAQLSIPDNAAGSPQQVALAGYAAAAGARATVAPDPVEFGQVGVGVATGRTVTVTSSGSAPLTISGVSLGGADAADYAIGADTCAGATIAVGSSCGMSLTLTAGAAGTRTATLSLSDDAPGSPQPVALTGVASASGTLTGGVLTAVAGSTLPVPGATVDLCDYSASNEFGCRSTTTSGSGVYTFAGLAPGAYRMEAESPRLSLQPGSAVVQVLAGPNTEDFTLTAPQPIPSGLTFNGRTGGLATSFWTSPDVITAPLDAPPKGSPGLFGVTVMDFSASPAGGSGAQPKALGSLQVEYRFDSNGVPRLVAINTTVDNQPARFGSWSTSLTAPAAVGEDVRDLIAQGLFTPSQLSMPSGTVVTVSAGGGKSVVSTAPVHGEFDYTIAHWSEFGALASAAASEARRPMARPAQAGNGPSAGLLGALAGASSDPSTQPCPSYPTYSVQNGQPTWTLPNGDQWTAVTTTVHTTSTSGDPVVDTLNGVEWQLTTPRGVTVDVTAPIQAQSANTVGIASPEFIYLSATIDGTPQHWEVYAGNGLESRPDSELPAAYWPDAGGFILGANIYVDPSGDYIADMMNAYNAQGNFDPRYAFYDDGTLHDLQTGAVWSASGRVITPGSFRGAPCGQGGPPQPSGPPDAPSTTPAPTDPNSSWAWIDAILGYSDPSGTVATTTHIPVPAAKVVLRRSASRKGPFRAVPRGSIVMSPSNRRNPDRTTALGGFGWDVLGGFYEVTAQHAGCRAAGGAGSVTHTGVLPVPPPVVNLRLVLRCPQLTRRQTHTTLVARKAPGGEVTLIATVHAGRRHRPVGLVELMLRHRRLGYVPLQGRRPQVVLSVAGRSTRGFRALYLGDGYNAPSRAAG